jgi:NAD(P)-dependent dehydrogenase (short-subunit alcohol dehydrogenase family)
LGLHLAFNNAGILGEVNPIADLSIDAWRRVIDINLNAVFMGCIIKSLQYLSQVVEQLLIPHQS